MCVCVCVGGGGGGKSEGYSELCNALLVSVMYSCNISCIAYWASRVHQRDIRRITYAGY